MAARARLRKGLRTAWGGVKGRVESLTSTKRRPEEAEVRPALRKRVVPVKSQVAIVRRATVAEMIETAIQLVGGIQIPPDATVLIKPNQNSDDSFPATSNPATVAALVNYVKRFRPKRIVVGDASFRGFLPTISTMKTTGVYQAATSAGAEVIALEEDDFVPVSPQRAEHWDRALNVSQLYMNADFVINQCVIKTHKYAVFSMALKNTIGVIKNTDRPLMHSAPDDRFRKMVAELNLVRPPDLVILDGQKAMVTGGPFSGDVKEANVLVASRDPVAADAVGLAVLKHLGTTERIESMPVWEQPVLKRAAELGLGARSKDEIELLADGIAEIQDIERRL